MQILIPEAASTRVAEALATTGGDVDVIALGPDKAFRRDGAPVDISEVDPEVFWFSLDLLRAAEAPTMFECILQGTRGRWLQTFSAGLDNPVFNRVMGKGVRISKSSAQAPAIAEYVMSHAISLLHPISAARRAQRAHEWAPLPFREIASTRWLMVGFGSIGGEIARRLYPFNAPLTVIRRRVAPEPLAADVRPTSDLLALLPNADVVLLACALTDQTRGIAGAVFFEAMKPGALLINIGRGGLVDEAALRAGLDADRPAMAVLDVFQTEPLPTDAWFWDHPKVRLTSHCAGAGDGVPGRGDRLFLENFRRYRGGEALLHEAHPSEVGL
jgi:phosphoglycerate dehydrogenase-like enzyme